MAITKMAGKARMPTQNVFVRTFSTYSRCATSQVLLVMGLGLLGAGLFHRAHEDLVQARLADVEAAHLHHPYQLLQQRLRVGSGLQVDLGVLAGVVDTGDAGQAAQRAARTLVVELDAEV